jgi:PAS domain S-box-containing protein
VAREAEDFHSDIRQRADLLKVVLDAVPGGVVHVGADGSIVQANAEALRILGMRFNEATCRFVSDWDPETINEDGSPCPASEYPVAKVLATGEPQEARTIGVRRPDGHLSWAVFRAIPALDPATGKQTGAIVTFLDITERKDAEDQLRRSEARWRSLAENHPDFVVIANREMTIQSINRVLPQFEAERVIGSPAYQYIHEDHVEDWKKYFQQALETKSAQHFDTRAFGPGGESVWYETILVPIPEGEASAPIPVERVLIVGRDITERRTMIAKLAEKERLASVGMLSASVAHEIMNPLTYVLANLDFALSDRCPPGARQTKSILDARDGAARMQQIVWDLRSLGRGGSEDLFYVDVRAVLETAVRLAGPEVAKNVAVHLDLAEVPGVLASESRLCQVFINLLMNAAQSLSSSSDTTASGLSAREIRIRTRVDEARSLVGVDVSDTGIGIEPEHLGRIFDPFFTTKRSGTGLGLSISKESLERMGGRIEVSSTRGAGTTFTVWLSTTRDFRTSDPRRSP